MRKYSFSEGWRKAEMKEIDISSIGNVAFDHFIRSPFTGIELRMWLYANLVVELWKDKSKRRGI